MGGRPAACGVSQRPWPSSSRSTTAEVRVVLESSVQMEGPTVNKLRQF